jgi:thioredoxin-related protein
MEKWKARIEVLANLALIICCVLFAVLLVKTYFFADGRQDPKANPSLGASLVGQRFMLNDIDWAANQQTLILVLQKGCRYCDESAPFYQRLVKEVSSQTKTHLAAVLPHGTDESKQYLKEKMVEIADVRRASARSLGLQATPTLVLVDNAGTVVDQWIGKLPAAAEDNVVSRLKQ